MFTQKEFDKLNKQFWKLKTQEEKIEFWRKYEIDKKNNPHFFNERCYWWVRLDRFSYSPDNILQQDKNDKTKYLVLVDDPYEVTKIELYCQYRIEQIREMDKNTSTDFLIEQFNSKSPLNYDDYKKQTILDLENDMKGDSMSIGGYMQRVYFGENIRFYHEAILPLHNYCIGYAKAHFLHFLKTGKRIDKSLSTRQKLLLLNQLGYFELDTLKSISSAEKIHLLIAKILGVHPTNVRQFSNKGIELNPKSKVTEAQKPYFKEDLEIVKQTLVEVGLFELAKKVEAAIKKNYSDLL